MNTHSAKTANDKGAKLDLTEVDAMVFPGEGEGVSPILVEYIPVPEPLLLRDHPTKRYAMVYTLIPVGGGRFGRGPLLSASVVDVASRN